MDSVHHIWCPLSSQEFQDLPDGAETTLTLINAGQFIENLITQWPVLMPESNASVRVIINGNFFTCYARI
ncbi:hypothetical protein, partial [Klebsiella sp. K6-243]|uniref:hypothetical protein n=1 Tax=Klebsiella sp. K6-243 TaxID=2927839 RepID=UPI0011912DC5